MSTPISNQTPVFQAQWLQEQSGDPPGFVNCCKKIFKAVFDVLSIVIFPIGLIRLTIWWIKDRAFALAICPGKVDQYKLQYEGICGFIKKFIYTLYSPNWIKSDMTQVGNLLKETHRGEAVRYKSPDGAEIDGVFIPGNRAREKVILYGFGNGMTWETSGDAVERLKPMGASIMMINPRGVGESTGWRYGKGYALDIYSAYEYLINEKGIDPQDILVMGNSMGGAYGACGAALVQEKYPDKEISAINLRSFATLHHEVQSVLDGSGVVPFLLRTLSKGVGFDMNVQEAWDKLKGKKVIWYHQKDQVIPYETASLAKSVKESRSTQTKIVSMHHHFEDAEMWPADLIRIGFYHNRPFCSKEQKFLYDQIGEILGIEPSAEPEEFRCLHPVQLEA